MELTVPFIKDSLGKQKTPGSPYNKEHNCSNVKKV
jgi:hypothetical protein